MSRSPSADASPTLAFAPPNFALAKYWGKRDRVARHPVAPSVSLCVRGLEARAIIEFLEEETSELPSAAISPNPTRVDEINFGGCPADPRTRKRVEQVLNAVRQRAGLRAPARVQSWSDFAVAAGLASSAAGLAAVAGAAWCAAGLDPDMLDDIADIARLGSGSACRSVHGGYVVWEPTESGSRVRHLAPASHWPLDICMAMVDAGRKKVGSTEAMAHAAATAPTWQAWLDRAPVDARDVEAAVLTKDFGRLADTAEANCLLMHATVMTARPPILYFQAQTLALFHHIRALRAKGYGCFFSVDAGPNVMVFCLPGTGEAVLAALRERMGHDLQILQLQAGSGLRFGKIEECGEAGP